MKRIPSLLQRLFLWQAAALAVTLSLFSIGLYVIVSYRLTRHHDEDLVRVCREAVEAVERAGPLGPEGAANLTDRFRALGHNVSIAPAETAGREPVPAAETAIVLANRPKPAPTEIDPTLDPGGSHEHTAGFRRVASAVYVAGDGRAYSVEIGEHLGDLDSTLGSLRLIVLVFAPLVMVLAIAVGAILLRRQLQPLRRVVRWAGSMDAERLDTRLRVDRAPREILVLADAFNQMTARLARSFEQTQEFTANASHELRTPLTSLTSSLEVALHRERSPEEYREVMRQSLEETRRLSRMVQNLLVMAQTSSEHVELQTEPVDLGGLLLESLDAIHDKGLENDVSVELEPADDAVVEGDAHWLRQLFDNLVDNAVKYSLPGGEVNVSVTMDEREARVAVVDEGVGIPEDERERIFERYHRVAGQDQGTPGVGLGLSIARWVAEAHGGRIEVDGVLGKGSRFTVVLPRARTAAAAVGARRRPGSPPA